MLAINVEEIKHGIFGYLSQRDLIMWNLAPHLWCLSQVVRELQRLRWGEPWCSSFSSCVSFHSFTPFRIYRNDPRITFLLALFHLFPSPSLSSSNLISKQARKNRRQPGVALPSLPSGSDFCTRSTPDASEVRGLRGSPLIKGVP